MQSCRQREPARQVQADALRPAGDDDHRPQALVGCQRGRIGAPPAPAPGLHDIAGASSSVPSLRWTKRIMAAKPKRLAASSLARGKMQDRLPNASRAGGPTATSAQPTCRRAERIAAARVAGRSSTRALRGHQARRRRGHRRGPAAAGISSSSRRQRVSNPRLAATATGTGRSDESDRREHDSRSTDRPLPRALCCHQLRLSMPHDVSRARRG